MKPYLVQIKMSLRLLRRDRAVLFFNYFFPLLFFVIFAFTFGGAKNPGAMAQVVNMVLVLGVLGSGFFGAGIRAVQDRESNILRRYKVAPISPAPIIVSSLVSGLVSFLPSIVLILWLAHGWMKMPLPHRTLELVIFIAIGAVAFRAVGMIVAAVVNSMQESQIVTQMIYLPMLFLSGATFPLELFPHWLKVVSQFIPAYYLFQGMQSIVLGGGSLASNILPLSALVVTLFVALFVGTKLFRWEKEEKIKNSAKLWILVVLAPFFLIGFYQFHTDANAHQAKIVSHNMSRQRTWLIQNARIFVGNGQVIPNGSVLVRNGKIVSVSSGMQTVDGATVIDASGKTLLPGLIDMDVRLGLPGGIYSSSSDYANPKAAGRALAAYLYSGVTAVRSMGDSLTQTLALRASVADASDLGA